jgi:hypothetical protein
MRVINVAGAQMGLNDPTPDRCRYADHALSADKHGGSRVSLLAQEPGFTPAANPRPPP